MSRLFFGAGLGLNGGSRGGFTPSILPSLAMWLDASKISGLADGDPVTTWADLSGQGNNATQSTPSAKPLYKVGIANGRPGVLGDGVDDFMSLSAGACTALLAGDKTVFAAVKWVTAGAENRVISVANSGGSNRFSLRSTTGPVWSNLYTTGAAQTGLTLATAVSTTVAAIAEFVQTGANVNHLTNGVSGGTASNAGTETAGVGALFANAAGAATFGNLYILEVIAYSTGLSASDRARVRRYLGAKWGVAVS